MKEQAKRTENDEGLSLSIGLADLIDSYVKSGDVSINGVIVNPPTTAPPFTQVIPVVGKVT